MVRRLLIIPLVQLLCIIGCATAGAQTSPTQAARMAMRHHGRQLTPAQVRTIEAVQRPQQRTMGTFAAPKFGQLATTQPRVARVNPSGSTLQGWRVASYDGSHGWYEVGTDGSQTLKWKYKEGETDDWGDPVSFPFNTGFLRDGKVYASASYIIFSWVVNAHGVFTTDGEVTEYEEDENLSDDLSQYIFTCAYDEDNDVAYAYTLNPSGTGYMLRSLDPETWQFTTINDSVPLEDVCVAFVWNPQDGKLLGMTMDSRLVEINPRSGTQAVLRTLPLPTTTQLVGITYSPLDKKMAMVYTDGDAAVLYFLDPGTLELEKQADLDGTLQYKIFVCADKAVDDNAPAAPVIGGFGFVGGALDGTVSVTLPSQNFAGGQLLGEVSLSVRVDGKDAATASGQPGETVSVPLSGLSNGLHTLSCAASQGGKAGPWVDKTFFSGYDTPLAPQNVTLTSGRVTWQEVTEGVNGGYIDQSSLYYNVYLNGEKLNAEPVRGTSFDFTMPGQTYKLYVATVEAVNHGYASDKGYSGNIKEGAAFPLPYKMTPTEGGAALTTIQSSSRPEVYGWQFDTGLAFRCYVPAYNYVDSWLFLPPVRVEETGKLVEVSFRVMNDKYGDGVQDNLEVAYGTEPDSASMTPIKRIENITAADYTTYTVWFAPQKAGDYRIGFNHYTNPKGNTLYLKQIEIKMSDRPAATPSACEGISAKPLPGGELKANVSLTLPSQSVDGKEIDPNATLTATAQSPAGEATATGKPGQAVSLTVPTQQGSNAITVSAALGGVEGLEASTSVYTGLDIPKAITSMAVTTSADYKTMQLAWEAPTEGANGGYVNPADVTYSLCLKNDEGWYIDRELGSATTLSYTPEIAEGMSYESIGILAQNSLGNCGTFRAASAVLGTPFELPMDEWMNSEYSKYVDCSTLRYGPISLEAPTEAYNEQAGYVQKPDAWLTDAPAPNGAFLAFPDNGSKVRVALPAFNTEGCGNVGIELEMYCGANASLMEVYAKAYGKDLAKVGSFRDTAGKGWKQTRVMLPKDFCGKKWVELKLDFVPDGADQLAAIRSYRIRDFKENDLEAASLAASGYMTVGTSETLTATVGNIGTAEQPLPEVVCDIYNEQGKAVATLPMTLNEGKEKLEVGEQAAYTATWTPTSDAVGKLWMVARITTPDMDERNDRATADAEVQPGHGFIVNDLRADADGKGGVSLKWTDPDVKEGHEDFETYAAFGYNETIGDFRNIDRDGQELLWFAYYNFPHQGTPKAWQVFSEAYMDSVIAAANLSGSMPAKRGDKYLAAFAPEDKANHPADDWFISPELREGSTFSFSMEGCNGYTADVEFLPSPTADPDDFTVLDKAKLITSAWKDFSFTLPEGAKYFAIRFVGGADAFFCLLDEIDYEPANGIGRLTGYDIYRDGALIAKAQPVGGSWTDQYAAPEGTVYHIVPVVQRGGTEQRGLQSNAARLGETAGIATVGTDGKPGEADGCYTLQGVKVQKPQRGIYIQGHKKVAVK